MSLLRIYGSISDTSHRRQWVLINHGHDPVSGEGRLADLPHRAEHVQLIIPAEQVLIMRTRVPQEARRRAGSVLAFAVEEQIAGEPENNQVNWLGTADDDDVLAIVDKPALQHWRSALEDVGIRDYELYCEMLLLPRETDEWSLAWNGKEGFVRTGELEGAATDRGDSDSPPLSLRLMLEEVEAHGALPTSVALYTMQPDAVPDTEAWQRSLGVPLRLAGSWDWRTAPIHAGSGLTQERQRLRVFAGLATRLRPAAVIMGVALAIHACALTIDWVSLAREQRALRQNMESRFRAVFPDAVAVVDPVLQMRRKLAEARHAIGVPDEDDFLPIIEKAATGMKELPAGSLRMVSYESGRLTLELAAIEEATAGRVMKQLQQAGLSVETSPTVAHSESAATALHGKTQTLTIIVRMS